MSYTMPVKRHKRITDFQRQRMIAFMEDHPHLQKGKYDHNFSMEDARRLWQKLTNILNGMDGPKKTWLYWRKSWHDMQCLQRKTGKAYKETLPSYGEGTSSADFGDDSVMEEDPIPIQIGETSVRKISPRGVTTVARPSLPRGVPKNSVKNETIENVIVADADDNVEHEYYKKKLELLERQTLAFETQAQALQMQAETLLELTETVKNLTTAVENMNNNR